MADCTSSLSPAIPLDVCSHAQLWAESFPIQLLRYLNVLAADPVIAAGDESVVQKRILVEYARLRCQQRDASFRHPHERRRLTPGEAYRRERDALLGAPLVHEYAPRPQEPMAHAPVSSPSPASKWRNWIPSFSSRINDV